ncbi:MAG: CheR family methyltransferase [Methanosarcina sp.]|uniref:CheR family methyltransferase n=1 Tax=Methanosarcina sp. TaxID=2213 RepID=UPI003BB7B5ED
MGATFFFRDTQTLKMIPYTLIPLILEDEDHRSNRNINIWSAGCANGSEPYTLAILLKEILDEEIFSRIQIYATDIDPNNRFENIIKKGSYPQDSLKKIPENMFLNNFIKDANIQGNYLISEIIREHVTYAWHNLLSLKPIIERPFDIILCKNVLLHFTEQQSTDIINMFYQSLSNSGFFITEQTQKLPISSSRQFEQFISNARIYKKNNDQF